MAFLRSLHAWGGAILALVLMLLGLSGVGSVLRNQIVRATVPAARLAPPPSASFGPALEAFQARAGEPIRAVLFAPDNMGVHRLYLQPGVSVYVDAQGREVSRWRGNRRIEERVVAFHRDLLLGKAGGLLVSLTSLGGLGLVLSGLAVWAWPRPRFALRLAPASARRHDVLAAHRNLGSLFGVLLLVQLTTAVGLSYGGAARVILGVATPIAPRVEPVAGPVAWSRILSAAQARFPDARLGRVLAPGRPQDPYSVDLHRGGNLNPGGDTVVFVDGRGHVAGEVRSDGVNLGTLVYRGLLSVHSGDYGGNASRVISGVVGITLTLLGAYGLWSFASGPRAKGRSFRSRARTS